jgi:crossover junction endonuclease MUS81
MSMAMIRLDPVDFITLRKIEFLDAQRSHAFASQLRLIDSEAALRQGQSTLFAFLEEETAPPRCSKFEGTSTATSGADASAPLTALKRALPSTATITSDDDWATSAGPAVTSVNEKDTVNTAKQSPLGITSHVSEQTSTIIAGALRQATSSAIITDSIPKPQASSKAARPAPRLSSHVQPAHPLAEYSTTETPNIPDFDPSKGTIFPAGSYEIILVLDTREIESKSNRDRFSEKLADKGVKLETRALRLGDVCWIATRLDGYGGEEDECVLDYVLERKRLDDLCSSMRDGRYHEQCVSCDTRDVGDRANGSSGWPILASATCTT